MSRLLFRALELNLEIRFRDLNWKRIKFIFKEREFYLYLNRIKFKDRINFKLTDISHPSM